MNVPAMCDIIQYSPFLDKSRHIRGSHRDIDNFPPRHVIESRFIPQADPLGLMLELFQQIW